MLSSSFCKFLDGISLFRYNDSMYIKLKNPIKTEARNELIFGYVVLLILIVAVIGAGLYYDSAFGFFYLIKTTFTEVKQDSILGAIAILACIVGMPVLGIYSIFHYFSTRKSWQRADYIYALDFQPTDVILMSGRPCPLSYSETDCQLTVHIKKVQRGKHSYVPVVYQISLKLDTDTPDTASKKASVILNHLCNLEEIFPFLDFQPVFRKFSYRLDLESADSDTRKYEAFVEQQIQNHLNYGLHLPCTASELTRKIISGLLMLLMIIASLLPVFTHVSWFSYLICGLLLCILFPIFYRNKIN